MLIVCPSCATSYMIEPASLGPAGRMVRCARCKTSWFTGTPKAADDGFVDDVIAEAQARETGAPMPVRRSSPPAASAPPSPAPRASLPHDDFGAEPATPMSASRDLPAAPQLGDHFEAPHEAPPLAISDAPSLAPIEEDAVPVGPTDDIESFAARRERMHVKRKQKRRSSKWTAIVLILLAANVALIGARHEVVNFLPQTASLFSAIGLPVNLRHLAFENVKITKEEHDGVTVLVVEGSIVTTGNKPVEVPRLRFAVRNSTGQEIYSWTAQPTKSVLAPGSALPFRSRLASPPPDSNDVMVRFFTARDVEPEKK